MLTPALAPLLALGTLSCASLPAGDDAFAARFTGRTLRLDYHHAGSATEEHVALDRLRLEGEWPGSRTQLLDPTNLGKYLFEVVDSSTNLALYPRGFASIYGEWETTGEARTSWRAFHESQRFPEPRSAVQLVLKKRAADGTFRELWSTLVDPTSRFVDRSPITARGTAWALIESGPSAHCVDLLVLADGYAASDEQAFRADVERLTEVLFGTEPFRLRRAHFNVRALHVPSPESGISNPRKSLWRDAPLGTSFNAFDSDRYVLTFANATLREVAAQVPYDALLILCNERKYGGGGIFNLYATCTADSEPAPYVFVHEFGHSFAGLADEYYTSQVAYQEFTPAGVEPWEPNVTALLDPARLKWSDLVAPDTPVPTPWDQARFDQVDLAYQEKRAEQIEARASDEAAEALMREAKATTGPLLASEAWYGRVGAFEGAAYEAKGLYRPEVDCIMFTRNPTRFCRVCTRAIERVIDLYVR
jgi:hypothetical protein